MQNRRQKRIAVVASGWHFPSQFYEGVATQDLPRGWKMDLFCVAHRIPDQSRRDKEGKKLEGPRAYLDKRLYSNIIYENDLKRLGWNFVLEPNTAGDWGNSNQWLEKHDYKQYDLLLFTHDDNLILSSEWFKSIIKDKSFKDWEILCNSAGMPPGWVRGSCEFFKPSLIDKIGGRFDMSKITLDRTGVTTSSEDLMELYDWNNGVEPLMDFIRKNNIMVGYCSPAYRVSAFCIEGERGYISNTHGANTESENKGLEYLKQQGII